MANVVLRHPDLPQPLVLDAPDGVVPLAYKNAGWSIDDVTSLEEATAQIQSVLDQAAEQAAQAPVAAPRFEEPAAEVEAEAPAAAPEQSPAESNTPEQAPAALDTDHEGEQ